MKRVRIYGTLGPACNDTEILRQMFCEGMDGARLNLSHSSLDESAGVIESFLEAANVCGVKADLLIDMQGPELRLSEMSAPMLLEENELIDPDELPFPKEAASVLNELPGGHDILLDDGKILLKTEKSIAKTGLMLRVVRGGLLTGRKSVALCGVSIPSPAMTDADKANIRKAKAYGVTGIMQPFVRGKEDLIEVRGELVKCSAGDLRLFAKIENMNGVKNIDEIVPYCDEIVIARGDLGNSMELWELPAVQKRISAVCRNAGRNFTVVTQMLDSMIHRAVPTRAEVSDIFNAIIDGASSVMLTGETAVGEYPVLAIRYMAKTVRCAEAYISDKA